MAIDLARAFGGDFRQWGMGVYSTSHPQASGGAKGEGDTDESDAFLAAVQAAAAWGSGMVLVPEPPVNYVTSAPITGFAREMSVVGTSMRGSYIVNNTSDLFQVDASRVSFKNLRLEVNPGGGNVFNVTTDFAHGVFERLWIDQGQPDKCVLYAPNRNFIDNEWRNCNIFGSDDQTAYLFDFVRTGASGSCNSNTFRRMRITCRGTYAFNIESQISNGQHDNTFRDITFEITNGGCIRLLGAENTLIEQCNIYDLDATTTAHMFFLGIGAAGANTTETTIQNTFRRGGTLGVGMADIYQEGGGSAVANPGLRVRNVGASGNPFTIDLNNRNAFLEIGDTVVVNNPGTSTVRRTPSGEHLGRRYIELEEITSTPASPSSNRARICAMDNGSGKVQIVAVYPSGAIEVLSTEP